MLLFFHGYQNNDIMSAQREHKLAKAQKQRFPMLPEADAAAFLTHGNVSLGI